MFGPALYEAFREVKRDVRSRRPLQPRQDRRLAAADRNICATVRSYRTAEPATWFDYSAHGGMGRAVEMCSGVGACRKKLEGTMCPSYRATLEEKHSTRGRANVLRLAMTGQLGRSRARRSRRLRCARPVPRVPRVQDRVSDRRRRRALQERVSRRLLEAPRHVLRARAPSATCTRAARWGSRLAPLSNVVAQSAAGRWLAETLLGSRPPPRRCRHGRGTRSRTAVAARAVVARRFRTCRTRRILSAPSRTSAAPAFRCSVRRHVHRVRRAGDRRRGRRSARGRGRRRPTRAACLLRPSADLARAARRGARAGGDATPSGFMTPPQRGEPIVFLEPSCLSARARRCAGAAPRRRSRSKARVGGPGVDAVRGVSRTRARRPDA